MKLLLAHDIGTSGDKASLFTEDGTQIGNYTRAYPLYQSSQFEVEQDPEDWWQAVCDSTRWLIDHYHIDPEEIAAVSFSGQMMGCLPLSSDGEPLMRAMIWADQRAQRETARLEEALPQERFYRISGHLNTPSYGIQKAMWIKENRPDIYAETWKFVNAKDYIVYRLTGICRTDPSDANGMDCLDLRARTWSEEILAAAGIDPQKMPEIVEATHVVGMVTSEAAGQTGLSQRTKVVMGVGDGISANIGAGSVKPGRAYVCLGTSAWVASTSEEILMDSQRRNVCWAHAVPGMVAPNATMQYAGGAYNWFKNTIGTEEIEKARALGTSPYVLLNEEAKRAAPGAGGVIFLPHLMGERAPRWNPHAKGAYLGLTASTTREELVRATLEGISLNLALCLEVINQRHDITEMTVIGGGAKGDIWCQILADCFDMPVRIPTNLEDAGSMGAAILAGIGAGIYEGFDAVDRFVGTDRIIDPDETGRAMMREHRILLDSYYKALEPFFK